MAAAEVMRRRSRLLPSLYSGNAGAVMERSLLAVRNTSWPVVISGFFEPVLYLLAMGYGMGGLIGTVAGPNGQPISYAAYIAPALLATSAMNGAIYDSTWNVFFKMHMSKLYQSMLQTSLGPLDVAIGEISVALLRGLLYAVGFLIVTWAMGLVTSWWALLMIPMALLIALGFAAFGMAATSFIDRFQQMDIINFVMLPMFLFSATLFPIDVFGPGIGWVIRALPLWHGVEAMRQLAFGHLTAATGGHVLYFLVMTALGVWFTTLRLRSLFLR